MIRLDIRRLVLALIGLVAIGCAHHEGTPPKPDAARAPVAHRVLVVVIDQLRADLVDRGEMPNLRALRDRGAFFADAYVGHLAAKTVVSHAVLTRGVFPSRLGWSDDAFRDWNGTLGTANAIWISELTLPQFQRVLPTDLPPSSVAAYLEHPKHAFIGEKDYAVAAMAGNEADIDIALGRAKPAADGAAWTGWLKPVGLNVPDYVLGKPGSRFWLDGRKTYGTEFASYSLGGDRFVPGDDPAHRGGDVWATDAAIAVMEHEDWGAMFVTLGGVDKVGHMMGTVHDLDHPNPSKIHFADQVRTADAQLGRLLAELETKGIANETAVVVTADHGGMWAEHLHARNRPGLADDDWQWGHYAGGESWLDPQPEIAQLVKGGGIQATRNDTAIRVWSIPGDPRAKTIPQRLEKLPGVIGVYRRVDDANGSRYVAVSEHFERASTREAAWERAHAHELLQTTAAKSAPEFVALLDEKTGYGVPGDHGGPQEASQRIPLVFAGVNVAPGRYAGRARLVDVAPTLWALAGKEPPAGLDGRPLCAAVKHSPACAAAPTASR